MRKGILIAAGVTVSAGIVLAAYLLTGPGTATGAAASTARVGVTGVQGAAGAPGSGPLDGQTFRGALGLLGKPLDVEDNLVFEDGLFVSTECEARCSYPPSPYYVREERGALSFISETRCPYKDATIVWRGTVENGTIRGESTWTIKRWYWTVEKKFRFEGTLAGEAS